MRFITTVAGLLLVVSQPLAAAIVKGVVIENEMGGPGIANVRVSAIADVEPVRTLSDGTFTLEFPNKAPGNTVQLLVQSSGMVVVNAYALRTTVREAENAVPVTLLLCREGDRLEMTRRFYRVDGVDIAPGVTEQERIRIELDGARKAAVAEKLAREQAEEGAHSPIPPASPLYRSYEAMALNRAATLYRRTNRLEEARAAYDEALETSRQLAQQSPAVYRPDVAETLVNLGNLLSDQNRLPEARSAYDEALKIFRDLAQQTTAYRPSVATTLSDLGLLLRRQDLTREARETFDEALKSYRELAQLNSVVYLPYVADTLNNLGRLNVHQNRLKEARGVFREALVIYEPLARKAPGPYGRKLESTRSLLEDTLYKLLESYRQLEREAPSVILQSAAVTLIELGKLFLDQNRIEESLKVMSEAVEIFETLNTKHADAPNAWIKAHAPYEQEVTSSKALLESTAARRRP